MPVPSLSLSSSPRFLLTSSFLAPSPLHMPSPWPWMLPSPQLCQVVYSSFSSRLVLSPLELSHPHKFKSSNITRVNHHDHLWNICHTCNFTSVWFLCFNTICLPRETENCRVQGPLLLATSCCPAHCLTHDRHPIHFWMIRWINKYVKSPWRVTYAQCMLTSFFPVSSIYLLLVSPCFRV